MKNHMKDIISGPFRKIGSYLYKNRKKIEGYAIGLVISGAMFTFRVYATNTAGGSSDYDDSIVEIVKKVTRAFLLGGQAVGALLTVQGVLFLFASFRNGENGDGMFNAWLKTLGGIVLIFLPLIIDGLGLFDKIGDGLDSFE